MIIMYLKGISAALHVYVPASVYESRLSGGCAAASQMPPVGTGQASISETARAEVNAATLMQSMMAPSFLAAGRMYQGPSYLEKTIKGSSFIRSTWGF